MLFLQVKDNVPPDIQKRMSGELEKLPQLVAGWLLRRTGETWDASTDPDGRSWVPLAKSTLEGRRRRNISGIRPLIATGTMRASLKMERGADFITISVDDPSWIHQKGTSRIPARPVFPQEDRLPDSWSREIGLIIDERIKVLIGE